MNRSKQKGTAAETAIVRYLRRWFPSVERRALNGAKDCGDIAGIPAVTIEVKACGKLELAQWMKEVEAETANSGAGIGAVWHKKRGTTDPGQWYVTMTGAMFAELLRWWTTVETPRMPTPPPADQQPGAGVPTTPDRQRPAQGRGEDPR